MSGLARLLLTRGIPVSGSELREWPALAGLRALGGTIHMSHEASQPRRRRHGGLLHRDPAGPPGAGRGAPARPAGAAPLRGAGGGDDRPAHDRGRRHPRQDHHHLDGHDDPAARRRGPVVRDRRRDLRGRLQRAPRHRRALRGRGRRERPVVPALPPVRRRSSPTSRPTTSTPTATWPAWRRRSPSSPGSPTRTASWSPAPTTRARRRLAATLRAEGRRVFTYGESRRRRPAADARSPRRRRACATWPSSTASRSARSGCRCPAGTWGSTAPPRCSTALGWACRSSRRDRGARPRSPACGGGSSSRASRTACGSTTSTPTTRPR